MTTDTAEAPVRIIRIRQAVIKLKTFYTFEGHEFAILFDPEIGGSLACLDDLCEVHKCSATPAELLPLLSRCTDTFGDNTGNPDDTLICLGEEELEIIRGLSIDWDQAVRFREWLIDAVFHTSPHREYEEAWWADSAQRRAEAGIDDKGMCRSADEYRAECWAEELKKHRNIPTPPATKRLAPDDLLEQAVTSGVISRLFDLLREVQERGQCSRREAAAVIVATVQVIGAE